MPNKQLAFVPNDLKNRVKDKDGKFVSLMEAKGKNVLD